MAKLSRVGRPLNAAVAAFATNFEKALRSTSDRQAAGRIQFIWWAFSSFDAVCFRLGSNR